ncbi:single-stranded DNA-binding protein [Streptomyces sp. MOE7]|uniref:single-stranded DNA-binding protein n=1 Tax=Streptomyces sp. MOE7 TaxID=1961713 RepID=UPI00268CFB45
MRSTQRERQGRARRTGEAISVNDTMVTLVGNAATAVEHRQTTAGVTVARFRLAATSRRWDKAQERWTDGETSFYTVRSWRGLADNVAASVAVGEPLVVQGRLRLREGEQPPERGGQRWFSAEVDAVAIGHDLSRGTAAFRRVVRAARAAADFVPETQRRTDGPGQEQDPTQPQSPSQSHSQPQPQPQPQPRPHPQPRPQPQALAQEPTWSQPSPQAPLRESAPSPSAQRPPHARSLGAPAGSAAGGGRTAVSVGEERSSGGGNSPKKVSVP